MKRKFFLIIMTLVLVFTLGACSLESKDVELGISASYRSEMVVGSVQKVNVEIADDSLNRDELVITWESSNPEIAEVTDEGYVKAHNFGDVTIKVHAVLGEAKKDLALKITVVELVYNIDYELNGGENSLLNPEGFTLSELPLKLEPATKEGYKFLGWEYEGKVIEEIPAGEQRNVILVATWEVVDYTLTLDFDGGSLEDETYEVLDAYTVEEEVALPLVKRVGHKFLGWYVGDEKLEKIEKGTTGNLEVVAKWEVIEYIITYDLDGGSFAEGADAQETYTVFDEVELAVPTKEGYNFLGWYNGDEKLEKVAKGSTEDLNLTAKWEKVYNVEFDLNGGSFDGVYQNSAEFGAAFLADFNKVCGSSFTLTNWYADYTAIKTFFGKEEVLARYNWLLKYMRADLVDFNGTSNAIVNESLAIIDKMINGDTKAISESANARTLIRSYIAGIMNSTKGSTGLSSYNETFTKPVPDFSVKENQEALMNAEGAPLLKLKQIFVENTTLPVPTKEGYEFLGWVNESNEVVKVATSDGKLVASWKSNKVTSKVTFTLDGGAFKEETEVPNEYVEGEGLASLPTPTKDGYKFLGWYLNDSLVSKVSAELTGDVELTAKWEKETIVDPDPKPTYTIIKVGPNEEYKTLDEAIAAATDNCKIVLAAGEYTLSTVINKDIIIEGPNANLAVSEQGNSEALINVTAGVVKLASKNIVFNGVHLKGTGGGAGVGGVYFEDGGNAGNVTFKSCVISDMNTFVKFALASSTSNLALAIEDCHIHTIGQFIVWAQNSGVNSIVLTGSTVDGGTCGSVSNSAAALFRVRCGSFEAYNNIFNGPSSNAPGYFEAISKDSYVKYNVFNNAQKYVYTTANNKLVFDKNLYLDSKGVALESVPSEVKGTGVTADATVAKSEAERISFYGQYLTETYPNRYFQVTYKFDKGQLSGTYYTYYDTEKGLASLPLVVADKYEFAGWYLNGEKVTSIEQGHTGNVELVARWVESGLVVDGTDAEGHYKTLADALAVAKDGDVIILVAGEYNEKVTVNVPNLTIKGPNSGVDAVSGTRVAEAIIKNVINVDPKATNLTIDGLAFTGAGRVVATSQNATYNGFNFLNNKLYDTDKSSKSWADNRYVMNAVVEFMLSSGGKTKNFVICNNSFVNCDGLNVLVNRPHNLTVDGNLFKNFTQDAFRIEGGYTNGIHAFTNNTFEVEKQGDAVNAIFFYSLSGGDANTKVVISNNVFRNLGQEINDNLYNGVISAKFYQEYPIEIEILNNIFDSCYNYFWFRNNGATASKYSLKVENNQFLGIPHKYYFGSYTGTDNADSNPHLAEFGANYYEDNEGNVITDMSKIIDKFFHIDKYGTALNTKPEYGKAEAYEFWTISYDLGSDQASLKGAVTEYNKDTGTITLPTPTWNMYHDFAGWELNGQIVTEIPAGTTGNLTLKATWNELEGNPVTLEFELNGGNWRYSSFEDISADLLADYNAFGGTSYTKDTLPQGQWVNINIHNFFYSEGMSEKWGWLASWLSEVGGANNKKYCGKLLKFDNATSFDNDDTSHNKYVVSYEFRAVMIGGKITSNSTFITTDYSDPTVTEKVWTPMKAAQSSTLETTEGKVLTLPVAHKEYLSFVGWYDNPEFTGEPITEITVGATNPKFYAKYADLNPVTEVKVTNPVSEIKRFETYQLAWEVIPAVAANKSVVFTSSNNKVLTVSIDGLITAVAKGTATITVASVTYPDVKYSFDVTVTVPAHIEGSYEESSYVEVGETIKINAEIVEGEGALVWSSADETIATVDQKGVVTGVKAGVVLITVKSSANEEVKASFYVTVLNNEDNEILSFILAQHNANIFTSYDLSIGGAYNTDIYSSISKIFYNHELNINTYYVSVGDAKGNLYENSNEEYGGLQFITFHYTGTMNRGADADNIAASMTGSNSSVSIHYAVGNVADGNYTFALDEEGNKIKVAATDVYQALSLNHGAWHAGDSLAREYSNSTSYDTAGNKRFEWIPTGLDYDGCDLLEIKWTASDDFYFEINGKKTTIKLPSTYDYKSRNTNHIYNTDGTISSQSNYTGKLFENRTPESFFNSQDFAVTVIDGKYYMGPTWWSYGQVHEGRICAVGGNYNSIGIESCCDLGSDLWYTWQVGAQLVAKLLDENNLGIERVKGHHFFDGKNCPQPMLENDLEIWDEFIELIKAELTLRQKYSEYTIKMVSNNPDIVDDNGRIIKVPEYTTAVSYKVTVTKGDDIVAEVTLGSIVPGIYEK